MKAGRELDEKVAREVMGWTKATLHDEVSGPEQYWCSGKVAHVLVESWTPSTFIHYAWQVFNKFTSRYIWYDDATSVWHCHFDSRRCVMDDCRWHAVSEDEDGCEAICLAALKAVGVEVDSPK